MFNLPKVLDYRITATLYVAIVAVVVVTPFIFLHFTQGRSTQGVLLSIVVVTLCCSAYSSIKGRGINLVLFLGFVPTVTTLLSLSLIEQGITAALWVFPVIMTFYLMLSEKRAWLANALIFVAIGVVSYLYLPSAYTLRICASLFAVSMFSAILTRVISDQQQRLHTQIITDSLTGLTDRVMLGETLERAIAYCQQKKSSATLIAMDIDHFKKINDSFGHESGDDVLRAIGEILKTSIRKSNTAFRLGGEEFLVLLRDIDLSQSQELAERLRIAITELDVIPKYTVKSSFGIARYCENESWKSWVKRADVKLYEAKNLGRNRVEVDWDT